MAEERAKDRTRLDELEDEAIRDVVATQESIGLHVVTDGEFRRIMYFNSFYDAVDGVAPSQMKLQFRGDDGSVVEHEGPAAIIGRISKIDSPAAREAAFVARLTDRVVKATFPTASFLVAQRGARSRLRRPTNRSTRRRTRSSASCGTSSTTRSPPARRTCSSTSRAT